MCTTVADNIMDVLSYTLKSRMSRNMMPSSTNVVVLSQNVVGGRKASKRKSKGVRGEGATCTFIANPVLW